jgi:hypothetical protein
MLERQKRLIGRRSVTFSRFKIKVITSRLLPKSKIYLFSRESDAQDFINHINTVHDIVRTLITKGVIKLKKTASKIIVPIIALSALTLLTSCAAIREYRAEYQAELRAENVRRAQTQPPKTYQQELIGDYLDYALTISLLSTLSGKGTCSFPSLYSPYTLWPITSPLFWYQYDLESEVRNLQYDIEDTMMMERFKLEMQMRLLMDELKREIAKIKK